MPLTPEQIEALDELERRGSLSPEQSSAFKELKRRNSSPEYLRHQHNLNRAAEADAQPTEVMGLRPAEIAQVPRMVGMAGGVPGAMLGETVAQGIEMAGGEREKFSPLEVGAQAAIPLGLKGVGKAASYLAPRAYESALKLSTTMKPDKRARIIATGLEEGRVPTTRSIKKSVGKQKQLHKVIEGRLAQITDRSFDAEAAASRLDDPDVVQSIQSALPRSDQAALDGAKKEFLDVYGPEIGPKPSLLQAHKMKQATYRKLGDPAYNQRLGAPTAATEKVAMKQLARGTKEELEEKVKDIFPELRELNAKDGALFELNRALAQSANRIGNRDIVGIGIPIKTMAAGPAGFIAGVLDTPRVKAALAVALAKTGKFLDEAPVLPRLEE